MSRKYPILGNKVWLRHQYWNNELSTTQISEIVGCNRGSVLKALKHGNIERRTQSEAKKGKKLSAVTKKKIGNANRGKKRSENFKRKDSERNKGGNNPRYGKHCSEETKHKIRERVKNNKTWLGKHLSEAHKASISQTRKELYQDPEFARMMFKAIAKKPTRPEKIFAEIADNNSLPFKYTGDGKVVIGGRCPDFTHLTKKIVVEVFGKAYHAPLFAFFNVRYSHTYEGTIAHYKKYGYKCIIFWDSDLVERKDAEQFILSVLQNEDKGK